MTQEEIIKGVLRYLEEAETLQSGNVGKRPQRQVLFKLCYEVSEREYHQNPASPLLTADALSETLKTRWCNGVAEYKAQQRVAMIKDMADLWDEWLYALDQSKIVSRS